MDKSSVFVVAAKHKAVLKAKFFPWLEENFHVFSAFCTEMDAAWGLGFRRYSGRTVVEYLRHHTRVKQVSGEFKISDHYTPDMVRLYVLLTPNRVNAFKYARGDSFAEYVAANV